MWTIDNYLRAYFFALTESDPHRSTSESTKDGEQVLITRKNPRRTTLTFARVGSDTKLLSHIVQWENVMTLMNCMNKK